MGNLLKDDELFCPDCGVPNTPEINRALKDIYRRIDDGRSTWEPLVYTAEDFEDTYDPETDEFTAMWTMERNMAERGLCPTCGRPDLRGVKPEQILSEEDYEEMCDMWAEQAAERRAGC